MKITNGERDTDSKGAGKKWTVGVAIFILLGTASILHAANLMHNSDPVAGTGSTKWAAQGGWGVAGGRYGQFRCDTCHEPDAANLKNIRKNISVMNPLSSNTWPNGQKTVTVTFLNQTSMGDDAGGHAQSSRICEVCHSQNKFHNANTANNSLNGGNNSHPSPKAVCTSCHKHDTGFKAACGGCHGNPPTSVQYGGDYGLIGGKVKRANAISGTLYPGAHASHTDPPHNLVCDTCHYINNGIIPMPTMSNSLDIGFFGFGGKVTSGTYVPYSSSNRGYPVRSGTANTTLASVVTNYNNANKCSDVYCHGGGVKVGGAQVKVPLVGGLNKSPQWDAAPGTQNQCGSCHGTDSTHVPDMGSHSKHTQAAWSAKSGNCDLCHPVTTNASHVQGSVLWELRTTNPKVGAFATYSTKVKKDAKGATGGLAPSATYGTCSNVACHSDGKGGPPRLNAVWGSNTFDADCSGCHGGNYNSTMPIVSDTHSQHINQIAVNGVNFGCVECHAQTVSADRAISSVAKHVDGFPNFSGAKAGKIKTACNNAYCHTDGKGGPGMPVNWAGGTPINNCIGCHGAASSADFTAVYGEPNYANGAAPRANSHKKHVALGALSCIYCHDDTVTASGALKGANHLDRNIQVKPGGGEGFGYPGGKTCSAITCHGAGSPDAVWGAQMPSNCTGCHGGNADTSPKDIITGKHTQHIKELAINGENYGCVECHAQTVNSDTNVINAAIHVNKWPNYSGARAGKNKTACNVAYCHSDGKGAPGMAINWTSGPAIDNCTGCHGKSTVFGFFTSVYGEPNYPTTGKNKPGSNNHQKHVGKSGKSTCVYCHGLTVADNVATLQTNKKHIDRFINVTSGGTRTFKYKAGKTCSNISCHGAGSPDAVWGDVFLNDCTGCHGGNFQSSNIINSYMHQQHVNQSSLNGENYGCAECHAQTVNADRTVISSGNHGDGFVQYSGARAGKNKSGCNAGYCHTDGKGTAGMVVSWTAGPSITKCTGCHGNYNPALGNYTSYAGEPNYANAGKGLFKANSHEGHVNPAKGAISCAICHMETTSADGNSILATGKHLDRDISVQFNKTRAGSNSDYNKTTRQCSTILCHGNGNPVWGDPAAGCTACHPNPGGAHLVHIRNLLSDGIVTFYNFTANRSTGADYRFGCGNCHPSIDAGTHRNGVVDIVMRKDKPGANHLVSLNNLITTDGGGFTKTAPDNFTCETVYCHSNGRTAGTAEAMTAADYKKSPNWYGGTYSGNKCAMCHDNPPQYADQSHYVAHSSLGDNGTPLPAETGHMVGIHFMNTYVGNNKNGYLGYSSIGSVAHGNPNMATTISCYICHSGIVSGTKIDTYAMKDTGSGFECATCHKGNSRTPLQAGEISNTALHVNGLKDVEFAPITIKTKAQLANVANVLDWTRAGTYKDYSSHDSANLGNSSWSRDGNGKVSCSTACHANQPGITWGAKLKCLSCHANQ